MTFPVIQHTFKVPGRGLPSHRLHALMQLGSSGRVYCRGGSGEREEWGKRGGSGEREEWGKRGGSGEREEWGWLGSGGMRGRGREYLLECQGGQVVVLAVCSVHLQKHLWHAHKHTPNLFLLLLHRCNEFLTYLTHLINVTKQHITLNAFALQCKGKCTDWVNWTE